MLERRAGFRLRGFELGVVGSCSSFSSWHRCARQGAGGRRVARRRLGSERWPPGASPWTFLTYEKRILSHRTFGTPDLESERGNCVVELDDLLKKVCIACAPRGRPYSTHHFMRSWLHHFISKKRLRHCWSAHAFFTGNAVGEAAEQHRSGGLNSHS